LTAFLDRELALGKFSSDCSNNGLQVEGSAEVKRAVFGVDGSLQLFEAALERQADFIFVHHGISWGGEPRRFAGADGARLRLLFQNNISLYAAHLPLDAHPVLGNNAVLGEMIGLQDAAPCCEYAGVDIGFAGTLPGGQSLNELAAVYEKALDCKAALFDFASRPLQRAVIVSGGGGHAALAAAVANDAELLITGAMEHEMYHFARERRISVLALGHYASETTGPRAVMKTIAAEFSVECEFIDLPTGL
jgi:dinuclear metal center YbgI/SA1388 family protein